MSMTACVHLITVADQINGQSAHLWHRTSRLCHKRWVLVMSQCFDIIRYSSVGPALMTFLPTHSFRPTALMIVS